MKECVRKQLFCLQKYPYLFWLSYVSELRVFGAKDATKIHQKTFSHKKCGLKYWSFQQNHLSLQTKQVNRQRG